MDYKVSLKAARINAGMLQKDAARALDVAPETLANWENGKTAPRATTLPKLSELYRVPIDCISLPSLFGLRGQKKQNTTFQNIPQDAS